MLLTYKNTWRSAFKWCACLQPKLKLLETLSNQTPTINVLHRKKQIVISHRGKGEEGGEALRISLSSTKTYVNGFCSVWVEVARPYFTATCMLAFSLPVIIWKMWLTNDCSFTVLFISKARAFLVLLQRNPLAAAVSFVRCWRSALFPELPHPWSETLEGNLWFKQLISGLFFFFFFFLLISATSQWGGKGWAPCSWMKCNMVSTSWATSLIVTLWLTSEADLLPNMSLFHPHYSLIKTNKKKAPKLTNKINLYFLFTLTSISSVQWKCFQAMSFSPEWHEHVAVIPLAPWCHITWSLCPAEVCMF